LAWRSGCGGCRTARGKTSLGYDDQGWGSRYVGGGGNAGSAGGEGGRGGHQGRGGRGDGQHDLKHGGWRRHSYLRYAFADSAAWSWCGDRWVTDGADQRFTGMPHGRHNL